MTQAGGALVPLAAGAPAWHALAGDVVLRRLASSATGLTPAEAARRLAPMGPNALPDLEQRSRLEILLAQLANLPSALLLGSSALSALLGDLFDAGAILAAVGLNAGIGYRIERTNEELLASWRRLEAGEAQVVRGGVLRTLPAPELVPRRCAAVPRRRYGAGRCARARRASPELRRGGAHRRERAAGQGHGGGALPARPSRRAQLDALRRHDDGLRPRPRGGHRHRRGDRGGAGTQPARAASARRARRCERRLDQLGQPCSPSPASRPAP